MVSEKLTQRKENFAKWYEEVVKKAKLCDYSNIHGIYVIMPYGYEIWENISKNFDLLLKKDGIKNAYFPIFVTESQLKREADHFQGFVPEVAWLEKKSGEEKIALRPTSEAIIYDFFSKWIESYRDLPFRINQWCNIVRWEIKMTHPFIRSREFLWQEGHTAHATAEEAREEALKALNRYKKFVEEYLALEVIAGRKPESEKFPGADTTYTLELIMPDGKALQLATSHFLSQNFSKPFNIKFKTKQGSYEFVYQSCWGITTRLIGAIVGIHGDDKGLVLPPRIAPIQVAIIPTKIEEKLLNYAKEVKNKLDGKVRVELDEDQAHSFGWKLNHYDLLGIPIKIEIGEKELNEKELTVVKRNDLTKLKIKLSQIEEIPKLLEKIQAEMLEKAKKYLESKITTAKTYEELEKNLEEGKMCKISWCESEECEKELSKKFSLRVVSDEKPFAEKCICGKEAKSVLYITNSAY
jgi:prolyl-tRNA synthetase